MISISINRDAEGVCNGFRVEGHAGYGEFGQDVLCSAISVLVINTINSIEEFTKDLFDVQVDDQAGVIELSMISSVSKESRLLLDSLVFGLKKISEDYGKDYIKIC